MRHNTIFFRIFIPSVILIVVAILLTSGLIFVGLSSEINNKISYYLKIQNNLAKKLIAKETSRLVAKTKTIAMRDDLILSVKKNNEIDIIKTMGNIKDTLSLDFLEIVNKKGRIYTLFDNDPKIQTKDNNKFVKECIKKVSILKELIITNNSIYTKVYAPLRPINTSLVYGVVIAATGISDDYVDRMKDMIGGDILIFTDRYMITTSLFDRDGKRIRDINISMLTKLDKKNINKIKVEEITYFVYITHLYSGKGVYIAILQPSGILKRVMIKNLAYFIVINLVVLVFSFFVLFFSTRSLTRPIIKLSNIARQIGEGELNVKVDIQAPTIEINVLASTITSMAKGLNKIISELKIANMIFARMQASFELESVLYILLTAINSVDGLNMDRCAIFLYDNGENILQGKLALGFIDKSEMEWYIKNNPKIYKLEERLAMLNTIKELPFKFFKRVSKIQIPAKSNSTFVRCLNGNNYIITDYKSLEDSMDIKIAKELNLKEFILVPIKTKNRNIGVLLIDNALTNREVAYHEFRFLDMLVKQASVIIENVMSYNEIVELNINLEKLVEERTREVLKKNEELALRNKIIEEDLLLAKKIQENMIGNKQFSDSYLDIYSVYIPMDKLAGDFYNIIKTRENNIGIIISDVSGHGVAASLITVMLKMSLVSMPRGFLASPSMVFTYINNNIHRNLEDNFITAIYSYINVKNLTMSYINAGHVYPLLIKENGQLITIQGRGKPLGIFENATPFKESSISLDRGDTILFFTDGLIESINNSYEMFGDTLFMKVIKEKYIMNLKDMIDEIVFELEKFRNKELFNDDIAIVGIRIK